MNVTRIAIFGHFGAQNFGNECTLHALLLNLRRRLPDAQMFCVCSDPEDVSRQHGLPAVPISSMCAPPSSPLADGRKARSPLQLLRRLYRRLAGEVVGVRAAFNALRGVRLFVIAGTGLLEDIGWSAPWYYEILKWNLIARLRGARVCFVSIGMGPIGHPSSRLLSRAALRLADYVSYRDPGSMRFSTSISLDTSGHHLFPDLAFSLPLPATPRSMMSNRGSLVIGVGLMDYYGPQAGAKREDVHELYLQKTSDLVVWLVKQSFLVRMLYGDERYDPPVLAEVLRRVEQKLGSGAFAAIDTPGLHSVADVVAALADTDVVIAPRYHNLVLALALGKPVLSLSYHPKNEDLLQDFGLKDYCHPLEDFDVERCTGQFEALLARVEDHAADIRRRLTERRRLLEVQYGLLLSDRGSNAVADRAAAAEPL